MSRDGRDPKAYTPWAREERTRSLAEFEKSYPFFFAKPRRS